MRILIALCAGAILCGCAGGPIPLPPQTSAQSLQTKLADVSAGENRVLIYCLWNPPLLLREGCIKGEGLRILVANRRAGKVFEREWGQAGYAAIVDYSRAGRGVLVITDLTWDPRSQTNETAPFMQTTVTVGAEGAVREDRQVLLKAEEGDSARIDQLVEIGLSALKTPSDEGMDRFLTVLAHLRNIAVNHPDLVLEAMKKFDGKADGHAAEELAGYRGEVRLLKDIRAKGSPASKPSR